MVIKVYGPSLSPCTARVLATLYEKNVTEYEIVNVDVMAGGHKQPEYLAIQPFGLVPAIVDVSLTLFESRAIARYIADKFEGQGTSLYGSTPDDRALVEQWMEVEGQTFNTPLSAIFIEKLHSVFKGEQPNEAAILASIDKLGQILNIYEAHLTKNKYLAGDFFSLADLSHTPSLNGLIFHVKLGEVIEARPHVKAWWEDISSRPAWKKVSALIDHEKSMNEASKQKSESRRTIAKF